MFNPESVFKGRYGQIKDPQGNRHAFVKIVETPKLLEGETLTDKTMVTIAELDGSHKGTEYDVPAGEIYGLNNDYAKAQAAGQKTELQLAMEADGKVYRPPTGGPRTPYVRGSQQGSSTQQQGSKLNFSAPYGVKVTAWLGENRKTNRPGVVVCLSGGDPTMLRVAGADYTGGCPNDDGSRREYWHLPLAIEEKVAPVTAPMPTIILSTDGTVYATEATPAKPEGDPATEAAKPNTEPTGA